MFRTLAGKVSLITGASSGIGAACAVQFAAAGSKVIITARRTDKLKQLQEQILKQHPEAVVHVETLDVTDRASVATLLERIPESLRDIDILINNAGLAIGLDHVATVDLNDVDTMFASNVTGLLHVTRTILPVMKGRNRGTIINVSSIAGKEAYAGGSVYCASKHAVDAITKSLRMELVATGIRVGSINPGLVETEFSVVRFRGDESRAKKVYENIEPLVADDVADAILFMASRPDHVQIADLTIFPSCQASASVVHRPTA